MQGFVAALPLMLDEILETQRHTSDTEYKIAESALFGPKWRGSNILFPGPVSTVEDGDNW